MHDSCSLVQQCRKNPWYFLPPVVLFESFLHFMVTHTHSRPVAGQWDFCVAVFCSSDVILTNCWFIWTEQVSRSMAFDIPSAMLKHEYCILFMKRINFCQENKVKCCEVLSMWSFTEEITIYSNNVFENKNPEPWKIATLGSFGWPYCSDLVLYQFYFKWIGPSILQMQLF